MPKQDEHDPARPTLITAMLPRMSDDQLGEIAQALIAEVERRGLASDNPVLAHAGGDRFVEDVGYMRAEQKEYFRLINAGQRGTIAASQALERARALESKVDKALAAGAARRQSKMEL
jgi:hypothetical protein